MIELPEALVLAEQLTDTLKGRRVKEVIVNHSPHKFAWFSGDSEYYSALLVGQVVKEAQPIAGYIEIKIGDSKLLFAEGIRFNYLIETEKLPHKHQLLVTFEDDSYLVASVQMYGGLWCYKDVFENEYYKNALEKPTPFSQNFTYAYFKELVLADDLRKKSIKEVLATKQRIPGLGNGVLQDILYNAKIHPKCKMFSLDQNELKKLYESIKDTLFEMAAKGGRDTEKDLFGCMGKYRTKVSKNTVDQPCEVCGEPIQKKAYMGGSIYFCEHCQKEK